MRRSTRWLGCIAGVRAELFLGPTHVPALAWVDAPPDNRGPQPRSPVSTEPITDYENLEGMQLSDAELDALVSAGGECVFNWTNKDGYPVGVVVAYVWRDGKFWTTCAARRARVPALRARPQSAIVINRGGKTASYKGDSVVHSAADADFGEVKTWFYAALSGTEASPDDVNARNFEKFLDSPHRVIIETEANLVVGFDVDKFQAFTAEAIAAGLGVD